MSRCWSWTASEARLRSATTLRKLATGIPNATRVTIARCVARHDAHALHRFNRELSAFIR